MESAELIAILREVKDRVRARYPETAAGASQVALPDLMPLVHARDAALGKVAAIGSVNPRAGGLVNGLIQRWKGLISRVLDWHVRDQVEFNRMVVTALDAAIEALNETNRAMVELGNRFPIEEFERIKDIRDHWAEWRFEWERKLAQNEIQFLRSVADLQGAFQHRATLMDANYRDAIRGQNADFHAALEQAGLDIQKRLWADLERTRREYEGIIYSELRTVRQRAQIGGTGIAAPPPDAVPAGRPAPPAFDYGRFAERFRGPEEYVQKGQRLYLPYFEGCRAVLDIGCGRGEFLEMMRGAGIPARGIDLSEESVALCRHKGMEAQQADLFAHLAGLPEASLDGIFCAQVVEHLPPERLPEMIKLCAGRLQRNGVLAIETPNPECLAIFSTHFYLDPTHTRPVPPMLLAFYFEEFGLGGIEVHRIAAAAESLPSVGELPEGFRAAFFGSLDYAMIARKV